METAIYARVSTNNGQDPEMQLRELREYCQRRGWNVAGEYIDAGISGATPGWLEQGITETVVSGLLSTLGPKAAHLSAVIFLPIYNPLPHTWALFRPFAVSNKDAKFPADSVRAFEHLRPLLQGEVSTPGQE